MGGQELLMIGKKNMFDKLDIITYAAVDVVTLKPLPPYAKPGTSQITGFVVITDDTGNILTEVMSGDIGASASIGCFSYNSNGVITLIFNKGQFVNAVAAITAIADYKILFILNNGTVYNAGQYHVEFYNLGTREKFYDSVVLNMQQLQNLIDTNIQASNLNPWGMNPFEVRIRGVLRS